MDAGRTRTQTSLSSPTWILLCSFWVSFINFKQISGPCLHEGLWFLSPDWVTILGSSLMAKQSLFWLDLGLNYGLSIILYRPVRIRSVLKKEAASGVRAGGWQHVGEWKTSPWEGPRDREGGCNWKASWEEEKIPEVQRRKDGKKWDIGELDTGSQGWLPRLLMNNQVKHIVFRLSLSSSSRAQGPPTTMRELATQRNAGVPLPWSISKNDALLMSLHDFPGGTSGREPACQCGRRKRCRFDHWVGKIPWRSKWQPTPVFLPGEFHGQSSLTGYSPWGRKDLDTTEATYRTCMLEEQRVPWHSNKEAKNKYGANSLAGF